MVDSSETFGQFLTRCRKEQELSLRALALKLDIAPAYLSDIEKGRRYPPEKKLESLSVILNLSAQDKTLMFDLAAMARENQVAQDISGYINETDLARVALRRAQATNLSEDGWKKVIEMINQNAKKD